MKLLMLGGVYAAELSMIRSFVDNGVEVLALVDTSTKFGKANERLFEKTKPNNICFAEGVQLGIDFQPDVVIHRLYKGNALQHLNAYQKLGYILFFGWETETDQNDKTSCLNGNYDALLYTHHTKEMNDRVSKMLNTHWFPYCVSGFEHNDFKNVPGQTIACVGIARLELPERWVSFRWWFEVIRRVGLPLTVYGHGWPKNVTGLDIRLPHPITQSTEIIRRHKAIINIESIENLPGAYSHKMIQAMGCGVPVLTRHRETYSKYASALIMPRTINEAVYYLQKLLAETKHWDSKRKQAHKFMHTNYSWYQQFMDIYKQYQDI